MNLIHEAPTKNKHLKKTSELSYETQLIKDYNFY